MSKYWFTQAIQTKYIGPSNMRGSRYKAVSGGGHRLTMSADDSLGYEENHVRVAMALADKLRWPGQWVGGGSETGYVFVNYSGDRECSFFVE